MSQKNQVSAVIAQEKMDAILNAITTIEENLDFLITLTDEERKEHLSMKDGNLPFVLKAHEHVAANPSNVPPFLDAAEFSKDVAAHEQLMKIWRPLKALMDKLADTLLVTGGESYMAALIFYQFIKHAVKLGVPGARPIYEDLSQRFKSHGRKRSAISNQG